jgi:hypothetical protein
MKRPAAVPPPQSAEDNVRALHVTWADPMAAFQCALGMSHEEFLGIELAGR